ncbi:unnamed protein product [Miscanthus lutarioriparius]|uniref:Transposase MuDR plant domain-containing protein n=1 Tax=Miscanthus lutarioriparius TaxID=422564 RepID=A0A811N435_9POAL|nr:unnamed protein product [Miscanthus lutarioriparius]
MAGRRRLQEELAPDYGPDDDEFSVEVHHGGFFCGAGSSRVYLDGKVDWFDHIKVQYWRFSEIDEIKLMLDYGLENVNVHWLLHVMDLTTGLRIVDSDRETIIMKQVAYKVKNFVLYFDQYNSLDDNAWEDIVLNPVGTLPKVLSPRKVAPERDDDVGSEGSDKDGSTDGEFVYSDYEVDDDDDDLFYDNVDDGMVDEGAAKGMNMATDREWDEPSSDEDELELPDSNEEGQVGRNLKTFRLKDMQNPIFKIGMKFASVELLRMAIIEYNIKQRVEIKMPKNDRTRIKAHCDAGHFKGENLKNQLWACARVSTITWWNQEMEKMKVLNKDAYAWLEKMPPNTWVRAFFSEYPKCDILLNNTCEVFNKYILEARELPILSML